MVAMSNCDRVVGVDAERMLITVEGGCVVSKVLEALEPHGAATSTLFWRHFPRVSPRCATPHVRCVIILGSVVLTLGRLVLIV